MGFMISGKRLSLGFMGLMFLLFVAFPLRAGENTPKLQTNQAYVEQLLLPGTLKIDDASSVLSYVLNSLPDEVVVYPTENYYYFNFLYGGVKYVGNLRLDASDRDAGKIHLAYFNANTEWGASLKSISRVFSAEDGVDVKAVDRLTYQIAFRGRAVLFKLNDLSGVEPPAGMMGADEQYIGPVFDESAIQFFLIYNKRIKNFIYVLNSLNKIPDVLIADKTRPRIRVAQRSGFVFYLDHLKDRLILIGVYERNAVLNTYFDGPFDQLPDNFIRGDELKQAFIDQNPKVAGTIDRFGNAPDGRSRLSISPYLLYLSVDELYGFDDCAQKYKTLPDKYYTCFDARILGVE
jgi:hypothetical protein